MTPTVQGNCQGPALNYFARKDRLEAAEHLIEGMILEHQHHDMLDGVDTCGVPNSLQVGYHHMD
jgi:hypothetical protein